MKRIIILLIGISAVAAALLMTKEREKITLTPSVAGLKTPVQEPPESLRAREVVKQTEADAAAETPSKELEKVKSYVIEFNVSPQLANELLEAAKKGAVAVKESKDQEMAVKQLKRAGADVVAQHLSGGYRVPDAFFDPSVAAALPAEVSPENQAEESPSPAASASEDASIRQLKSEALAALGFSAMLQFDYAQAEKVFTMLLRYYNDSEAAPMVRLELARLLLEQNRVDEARSMVVEAIHQYRDDQEYVMIAEDLKKTIEDHES